MLIKRQYGDDQAVSHVRVFHTGTSPEQNFSHRLVAQAMAEGWMSIDVDELIVKAEPEDLHYRLVRTPGYYCISSGERIPISAIAWIRMQGSGRGDLSRMEALAWLKKNGKGPGDYTVTNAYECVLDDEQHAKFKATGVKA